MVDTISLEASPEKLWQKINDLCKTARHDDNYIANYVNSRRKRGGIISRGLVMNGDSPDAYLNSRNTFIRFPNVRAMLRENSNNTMIISVSIDAADPIDYTKPDKPEYFYHRIATMRVSGEEPTSWPPLKQAILQRMDRERGDYDIVRTTERNINGSQIGDMGQAQKKGDRARSLSIQCREPAYRSLTREQFASALERNLQDLQDEDVTNMQIAQTAEPPEQPEMTYQSYADKLSRGDMPKGEVHLAVVIVDQLPNTDAEINFPGPFALPADVVVTTQQTSRKKRCTVDHIRSALKNKLEEFCERDGLRSVIEKTKRLFSEEEFRDKWRFDLWILPLRNDGEKMLYRMGNEDSVNMFLDEGAMVEGEVPLMYLEAHLIPS